MASKKGKEIASGKGKRVATETDNINKKKRSISNGAVRFFDDSAHEVHHHDDDDDDDDDVSTGFSDFGDDWDFEDDFEAQPSKVNNDGGKSHNVPVFPKEEELSESELEKMVEERYRPGSSCVTYADDRLRNRRTAVDGNEGLPSYKEPTVWKVKCMIGREKQSVFCLMQKFVELNSLGNKLSIISAIFIEHIKGYIYVEAERQSDINEACKGVSTIYSSRLAVVPKNEVSSSLSVQNKCNEVSIGSWARVKNGKYRGDLAQVIAVNDSRKKATVKLIPRIDLQVLAEKYGGGVSSKKATIPAPKLVTSTELEEFRPLIQHRRDRESGLAFDVLDGMMLKDGYLYKKVLMDSLNLYGVIPSQEELLKFESSKNEVPDCHEWLTELYGEKKKEPKVVKNDKGGGGKGDGGKGEGSSSSSAENSFDVSDLVLFNKKDFGVIVGLEKEEYYKVLKEGSEGALVMTVDVRQLKKASFENRFTALDKHKKIISINDNVRVLEGPLEGRQGNVKHVYRGIIFSHDEIEQENNGYFCCKSHICEKVKSSNNASKGKDGESSFPSFDDPPSSPVATEKPWETRRNSSFNSEDQEGFTVGQSLRIRVGPLKGYLCRVLAVRRTGVTVKLDSQHKILTVKTEHLAEVRGRSSAIPMSDDKDAKPFDLLGNSGGSSDWMTGAGTSTDGGSSWPAFPSSGPSAMEIDEKDEGGGGWGSKPASKPSAGWGNTSTDEKPVADSAQAGGWGKPPKTPSEDQAGSSQGAGDWGTGGGNWGQPPKTPSEDQASSLQGAGGWGNKPKNPTDDHGGSSEGTGGSWGSKPITAPINDANSTWGSKPNTVSSNDASSTWGKIDDNVCNENSAASGGSSWGKSINPAEKVSEESIGGWGNNVVKPTTQTATWGKPPNTDGGQIENRRNDASPDWGKTSNVDEGQGGSWVKNEKKDGGAPAWGKKVESSAGSQGGSWGKNEKNDDGGAPAWGKKVESSVTNQGGSWGKNEKKDDGGAPAWGKKIESSNAGQGGSWGKTEKKDDGGAPAWGKKVESSDAGQGGSWGKNDSKKDDSVPAWGKKVESSDAGQGEIWGKSDSKKADSVPAWGKKVESSDAGQGEIWGKSDGKKADSVPARSSAVESSGGGESGSWGEHTAKKNESSSAWGKIVESSDGCESGSWGKSIAKNSSAPAWGKNVESSDKGLENSSWGKPPPPKSWGNKEDDTGEKKAAWGSGGGSSWGNKQNDGGNSEGGYGVGGDFGGRRGGRGGWRGGRGGRSFGDNDQGERGGSGGGGRWSDQGGERGERGGYRGRGRSNYGSDGGFGGGRGRERRDDNSDGGGQSWSSAGGGGGSGWGSNGSGGGSGWGASKESNEGQPSILGKPKGADIGDGAQSSGWGASNDKGGSNGQWGKPPGGSSSWGKGDSDGGNKGGW